MKTSALIIACLAGQLAFGFLFAGFVQLATPRPANENPPKRATSGMVFGLVLDAIVFQGAITTLHTAAIHWPIMRDARRHIYIGAVCGLVTLSAAFLGW